MAERDNLLNSAKNLPLVDEAAAKEYYENTEQLIASMNVDMLKLNEVNELVGGNLEMMKDNHANHARFMVSVLKYFNPEVFVETVLWVFRTYRSHGFKTNYWTVQLSMWLRVLSNVLSENSFEKISPYYRWMQTNIPLFVKLTDRNL